MAKKFVESEVELESVKNETKRFLIGKDGTCCRVGINLYSLL